MLIALTEALRADLRAPLDRKARDALINLATAAYEGKHLLAGSRRMFGDLQQLAELGQRAADQFKEAGPGGSEARGLIASAAAFVQIAPLRTHPRVEHLHADREQIVFHLPLDHFADTIRAERPWIVAEHKTDVDLYHALGETAAARRKGLGFGLRRQDGHGGKLHHSFKERIDEGCAVLCVADSDRYHAEDSPKQTATNVLACCEAAQARGKLAAAHVLPCRELENLIPADLVIEAVSADPAYPGRVHVLAARDRLGLADFADLKDLVRLPIVRDYFLKLRDVERARLCFTDPPNTALEAVAALVWSFGVASRRGRT